MPATTESASQPLPNSHRLFKQVQNFRDLGGHLTSDGRRIQTGRLLRSANPGLATADDIARLQNFNLNVVIDFRTDGEKKAAEAPFGAIFNWIADPIMVENLAQLSVLSALQNGTAEQGRQFMLAFYREFPLRYQGQYRRFLQLAEQNHNILFHCTAGKDRTGFASLLLLSALGVAPETIIADYLASNLDTEAGSAHLHEQVKTLGLSAEVITPLLLVEAAYLEAAQQVIDDDHGGMQNYLAQILGVDVARIRENYLESVTAL
ncbi:tyrosine-protein phosphatase [Glaciimonas immobilis]|uniref:Protein-tyrosine phosphatase n=1 Tax=Glaciimonas immobilis TaxID=728004 RepID=A0A840RPU6_9BURK|nr:tyrosine-protein phosphatase [Glaciimonas immobilis]KAF3999911.1 tyrosine-protein phosphatase [Glaciimonas immobilis]MBB5200407.1 protein-tyrosine phosphatase [Glaciimonas immobilis]